MSSLNARGGHEEEIMEKIQMADMGPTITDIFFTLEHGVRVPMQTHEQQMCLGVAQFVEGMLLH